MDEELDLLDLLFSFWRKRVLIIFAVILGALIGLVYTRFMIVPKYTSSVTLILAKSSTDNTSSSQASSESTDAITQSDITLNQKLISTYEEILKSKRVSKKVIENLSLNMTYSTLKSCISVSSVKNTDVIKLSITTKDPELSAKIADEMAKVFEEEVDRIYNIKNISIIDSAEVNVNPINKKYMRNTALFALVFAIIVMLIIFILYYFDNTVKTADAIQELTGLPVLCSVPKLETEKEVAIRD